MTSIAMHLVTYTELPAYIAKLAHLIIPDMGMIGPLICLPLLPEVRVSHILTISARPTCIIGFGFAQSAQYGVKSPVSRGVL